MNDSYANVARIAKEMGPANVALHPDDAEARGLNEGDEAKLTNDTGEIVLKVRLSDEIPVGVALAHKGRWPKREENRANVNFLNPGKKTDMGEGSSVHGVEAFSERRQIAVNEESNGAKPLLSLQSVVCFQAD